MAKRCKKGYHKKCVRKSGGGRRRRGHRRGGLPPALRAWNQHVAAYRAAHPGVSLTDALKAAKHTYRR